MPPNNYPFNEELAALNELVDNVRVDLLQTSMIVHYIQDFFERISAKTFFLKEETSLTKRLSF